MKENYQFIILAQIFQPSYTDGPYLWQEKTARIWLWRQCWVNASRCFFRLNLLEKPENEKEDCITCIFSNRIISKFNNKEYKGDKLAKGGVGEGLGA